MHVQGPTISRRLMTGCKSLECSAPMLIPSPAANTMAQKFFIGFRTCTEDVFLPRYDLVFAPPSGPISGVSVQVTPHEPLFNQIPHDLPRIVFWGTICRGQRDLGSNWFLVGIINA